MDHPDVIVQWKLSNLKVNVDLGVGDRGFIFCEFYSFKIDCRKCKRAIIVITVICVPVLFPFRHTALKFSRSPYLDNHLS